MKLFILTLFVILSSCCEEAESESHDHEFSFIIVNGELPEPPERFRIVSKAIYDLIKQDDHPAFEKYTETIPLSDNATFHLVPIQGGEFAMGSSADDPDHKPDELPAHRVQVDCFGWHPPSPPGPCIRASYTKLTSIIRTHTAFLSSPSQISPST